MSLDGEANPEVDRVYCSLRVYRDDLDPNLVSEFLSNRPDRVHQKDQPYLKGGKLLAPTGAWFFFTLDRFESQMHEDHINWLLDQFDGKHDALRQLQAEGYEIEVSCYWLSVEGRVLQLSPATMRRLSELNLVIWFDIYG